MDYLRLVFRIKKIRKGRELELGVPFRLNKLDGSLRNVSERSLTTFRKL